MIIELMTLFPDMCETVLSTSIVGRARAKGVVTFRCRDIRAYSKDKHGHVDDTPYGGGMGMVLSAQPVFDCYEAICRESGGERPHLIYMTPAGRPFTQRHAAALSRRSHIVLLCGHYEGMDARVVEEIVDEELSIGDYVLTGGELPALCVADAVTRLLPGALSDAECYIRESHSDGLLEYPQYTKPQVWHGRAVPEVLLSGHHARIEAWRHQQSLLRTFLWREDLYHAAGFPEKKKGASNSVVLRPRKIGR